jgi:fructokinase
MADAVCLGELLIDFVPAAIGHDAGQSEMFQKSAGGAPANVAVGLARLGISSAFMGQVGDEMFGHYLGATLAEAGVDVSPLRFTRAARTMLAFVSLAPNGEREFLFYRDPSADAIFSPADLDEAAIRRARLLHFGSISLIAEPSRAATLEAIGLARRHGLQVSYDPNLRLALWPDAGAARRGIELGLRQANIVKIAAEEASFLTGTDDPLRGARSLWHGEMVLMVVTLGAEGCIWLTRDADGAVPGFAVEAIDTTGAGDAFMAGLLSGLLETPHLLHDPAGLAGLCRFANAMGAMTTTNRGAIPALPKREAVEAFLRRY